MNRSRRPMEGNRWTLTTADDEHPCERSATLIIRVDGAVGFCRHHAGAVVRTGHARIAAAWLGRNTNNRHKATSLPGSSASRGNSLRGGWTVTHRRRRHRRRRNSPRRTAPAETIVRSGVAVWMLVVLNLARPEHRHRGSVSPATTSRSSTAPINNADAPSRHAFGSCCSSDGTGCRRVRGGRMRHPRAGFSGWPRSSARCRRTRRASTSRPSSPRSCSPTSSRPMPSKMAAQLHSGARGCRRRSHPRAARRLTGADQALTRTDPSNERSS